MKSSKRDWNFTVMAVMLLAKEDLSDVHSPENLTSKNILSDMSASDVFIDGMIMFFVITSCNEVALKFNP